MNRHQKTDKGLGGVAAGPDATTVAEQCFQRERYRVRREPSDWVVDASERGLQQMLIDGWAEAATEMAPESASSITQWRARRLEHVATGCSRLVVGHYDLAACPREAQARD
jgi:hypothetical protein